MVRTKKKIAFIGSGKQAQCAHIANFALRETCEPSAIVDIDEALARQVASRFGIPKVFASHSELLSQQKPDAVVITLPPFAGVEMIVTDCLKARVPVFMEKPIAASVEASRRIAACAAETKTPLFIGYHKRSDHAAVYAKKLIERCVSTGEIGAMRYVRIHVSLAGDWISNGYRSAIKNTPVPAGGKENIPDMGVNAANRLHGIIGANSHQFDLMRYLFGQAYQIAYADPSGVLLAVKSRMGIPGIFEFTPYRSTQDWRESALVAFEHGYVSFSLPAPLAVNRSGTAEYFRDDGDGHVPMACSPVFPAEDALWLQSGYLLAALDGETTHLCTADEALEAIVIAQDWCDRLYS